MIQSKLDHMDHDMNPSLDKPTWKGAETLNDRTALNEWLDHPRE